ncbi:MAG TPA: nuclear transport factor 2 family protein [Kofleriaceae bacterium]|nr:nuclear transport factor 2 family protein [Kofleriaceae bacterium]
MPPMTAREVFERFQACALARDWQSFGELAAEDAVMEFPFAPPGAARETRGRDAIRAAARESWGRSPFRVDAFDEVTVHEGREPGVLFAEYDVHGAVLATGAPFRFSFAMLLRVQGGLIATMREYMDPLAMSAAARAGARDLVARFHRAMLELSADALADLLAADAVYEYPFARLDRVQRLHGRDEIRARFRAHWAAAPVRVEAIRDVVVHDTFDPEVVVCEQEAAAVRTDTGAPFTLRSVLVLRVRGGAIVHARDYGDALGSARALDRVPLG